MKKNRISIHLYIITFSLLNYEITKQILPNIVGILWTLIIYFLPLICGFLWEINQLKKDL